MEIYFTLQSESDGSPLTGASNITVYLCKDGGTLATSTNSAVEVGRGIYKLTLTSSESEFSTLLYQPVCTGAQTNTWGVDAPTDISGLATSSSITTLQTTADGIKSKTDNLPSSPAATSDIPTAATVASSVWSATTRTVTGIPSTVTDLLNTVYSLLGDWTMGESTLTTNSGTYTLTRDADGNIVAITPDATEEET